MGSLPCFNRLVHMFRLLFRFFLLIAVFAILRYVVVAVARFVSQAWNPHLPSESRPSAASARGGELKQDPVCGTFVATSSSIQKTVNGELIYFCSAACRDKFKVA